MLLVLDIGFANMGWLVFHKKEIIDCGVVTTEKTQKKGTRVADDHAFRSIVLAKGLYDIIESNGIEGIIGELPSGGAQSAKAMGFMMSAISVVAAVGTLWNLPMEWATPTEVKKALVGHRSASKEQMMAKAGEKFGFRFEGGHWHFKDKKFIKGQFEHIADATGVYIALKNDNLVKMFG